MCVWADDVKADHVVTLFCDTSGFGAPSEAALTPLLEEHGPLLLAISSVGQFQAYVEIWRAP